MVISIRTQLLSMFLVAANALALPAHIAIEHGHIHASSALHCHAVGHGHEASAAPPAMTGAPICCDCHSHDEHAHCVKEHLTGQTRKTAQEELAPAVAPVTMALVPPARVTCAIEGQESRPCLAACRRSPSMRAPPAC